MVVLPETFIYVFPAVYGLIVGLVELFFVHADESGLGWLGHGLHALPWCIIFTYAASNALYVAGLLNVNAIVPELALLISIPLILGLITTFKVKAAAAIAKGGTVGEKFIHALAIGALVALAPFVYGVIKMMNIAALAFMLK